MALESSAAKTGSTWQPQTSQDAHVAKGRARLPGQLRKLIDHLRVTDSEFAAILEVAPSTVSRALGGDRQSRSIPDAAWRELGIGPEYWEGNTAPVVVIRNGERLQALLGEKTAQVMARASIVHMADIQLPPLTGDEVERIKDAFRPGGVLALARTLRGEQRHALAEIAAHRAEGDAIAGELLRARPPVDDVPFEWWVRKYLDVAVDGAIVREEVAFLQRLRASLNGPDAAAVDEHIALLRERAERHRADFIAWEKSLAARPSHDGD